MSLLMSKIAWCLGYINILYMYIYLYVCIHIHVFSYHYNYYCIISLYVCIYHSQHRVHSTKLNVDSLTLIPSFFYTHICIVYWRMKLKGEVNPKPQCNNAQPIFIQPACIKVSCQLTVDLKLTCVPLCSEWI